MRYKNDPKNKKIELRNKIRKKINNLSKEQIDKSNKLIFNNIINLPEYINAKTIFCYVSTSSEINTKMILDHSLKKGKLVAVPKCVKKGYMNAYQISSLNELSPGAYGILEPNENSNLIPNEELELAIVPCISCDKKCNRLGQGGGYYDRFLVKRKYPAVLLCRKVFMTDNIPLESFDQIADIVVTEDKIYRKLTTNGLNDSI